LESVGDDLTDFPDIVLRQILHPDVLVDARFLEDLVRGRPADTEDVRQTDFHALIEWKIYACNTSHSLSLPLFVLRVDADDPDDALPPDDLALAADSLYR